MASRIQGITVEIGGDTTKLSKALESVNKSIKGTQSGLKDVNKLLKLDPSNTELVVQKQKMLKDAIEATKEKLATLKTAAQQANEQLANGEITQQQYDALQREIVETEQNLRSLQDQAATTNATLARIDEAGEKLQNIGSSVENVGKKFLPVTAAVTGLGTAAVKTAADFDSEMSKVSAISGATGDDFDQLRAKAREMGAKTKFSASEAASAMEYMAMAGYSERERIPIPGSVHHPGRSRDCSDGVPVFYKRRAELHTDRPEAGCPAYPAAEQRMQTAAKAEADCAASWRTKGRRQAGVDGNGCSVHDRKCSLLRFRTLSEDLHRSQEWA